jgi:hypothetical protein
MHRGTFLSALVLAALGGTASAAVTVIEGTEFQTSGWTGAAVYDEAGTTFRACYMLRDFGDTDLVFTLDKVGQLSVGLRNETWDFADDFETTLRFQLDDWVDTEVGAAAETAHVLLIPAGADAEIVQAFQQGSSITVSGDLGSFELPLTGTTNALPALADCVASVPNAPGKAPLTEEDKRIVRALALYPAETRQAILEATLYPEIIEALGKIAENSRKAFRDLVGDLSRESQALVWDVVRYPAMLDAVTALGPSPSEDAVRQAIADQPPEAQEKLLQLIEQAPELAAQAHEIRLKAEQETDTLLSGYPLNVESAFRVVIEHPEALAKMNERPDVVERIAEVYRRDPDLVLARLEEVSQQIDADYDEAVQAWAQQLEANPEAAEQLVSASDAYAQEKGLPELEPQDADPTTEVNVDVTVDASAESAPAPGETYSGEELQPYPYYYGPPPGYDDYYPYYQQDYAGYYLNEIGELVITGLVTYAFADWIFDDHDDHWDDYPDFSSEVIVNVDRDNVWIGGGNDRVRDWMDDNRGDLPDGWFDNDGELRDRMHDYAGSHEDFKEWRDQGGGDGRFEDFVRDRGDAHPELRKHNDKLLEGKGSGKTQLGNMLSKDKGGNKELKGKLKDQNLLGGVDPGKKKDKLGGGGNLLAKDKEQGGFVQKSDKKGKVKLQKTGKDKKGKKKKQRQQEGWKGKGGKGKGKKG